MFHDIGKLSVPDSILTKPDRLTPKSTSGSRSTPPRCPDRRQARAPAARLVPIIRHHHERWDGRGYPDGLAGNEIPLAAAVVGLAGNPGRDDHGAAVPSGTRPRRGLRGGPQGARNAVRPRSRRRLLLDCAEGPGSSAPATGRPAPRPARPDDQQPGHHLPRRAGRGSHRPGATIRAGRCARGSARPRAGRRRSARRPGSPERVPGRTTYRSSEPDPRRALTTSTRGLRAAAEGENRPVHEHVFA